MAPFHLTVSQIRVAASCPRIFYFDAEATRREKPRSPYLTRIWKKSDEGSACGTLFHNTIERFNSDAATAPAIRQLLEANNPVAFGKGVLDHIYWNCLKQDNLVKKTAPQQQTFMATLRHYVSELADILTFAFKAGKPVDELLAQMFGDKRRRVDVTFHVGPENTPVHITGILDYVFYDYRTANHRILDYKLTPADHPANDLFQVCIYALMHHQQHHTEPDAGVLYLHPDRKLVERKWADIWAERGKVYDLLASMREWARYDESQRTGLQPPGDTLYCDVCKWNRECESRLGPRSEGQRLHLPLQSTVSAETAAKATTESHSVVNDVSGSLWIGTSINSHRPLTLPPAVLPTHVTVVGAAGSGKTWLAKVLVEEAILEGIPVLAIDPQGDLVQFLQRTDPARVNPADLPRYQRFSEQVEPRVFTPGSSQGIRMSLNPIRLPNSAEMVGEVDPRRREEERAGILAAVASNLVSMAKCGGETDSQQTFLLMVLQALSGPTRSGELSLSDVAAGVIAPENLGIDEPDIFIKKAERQKLGRKLNNLLHGPTARLFSGGVSLDMDQLCRPIVSGRVPLNVIYLNALANDEQKQGFVAALASEVYRWMVTSPVVPGRTNLLFYLDEARDYIPAGAAKPPAKSPLIRLFTQGRKYGVGCLMCTQSPRSVDYNVFGNCSTKLIGRLESAQDADRVAEWFTQQGPVPAWIKGRAGAEQGTFVGRWPTMPPEHDGQVFRSRPLFSVHGGAWSPDRLEQELRDDPMRRAFDSHAALVQPEMP